MYKHRLQFLYLCLSRNNSIIVKTRCDVVLNVSKVPLCLEYKCKLFNFYEVNITIIRIRLI